MGKGWWYWQSIVVEEFVEMLAITLVLIGLVIFLDFILKKYFIIKQE